MKSLAKSSIGSDVDQQDMYKILNSVCGSVANLHVASMKQENTQCETDVKTCDDTALKAKSETLAVSTENMDKLKSELRSQLLEIKQEMLTEIHEVKLEPNQNILAGQDFSDIQNLAEAADRIWETRGACVQQVIHTADSSPLAPVTIEAVSRPRFQPQRRPGSKAPSTQAVCYYHLKFGPQARRCQPGCKFSSLLPLGKRQCQPLSVAAAGNAHQPNTFSVVDRLSGRSKLILSKPYKVVITTLAYCP
ncbi:hypothetical protein PoB_003997800 [Plakobranchus ocellatus]|uniref:Uncharacterized protein n=1 Tax=Plakobranchus ocellatus TaxID=259542 RepID=A0AAV4B2Y7_9GAST|nr:hypothetical protein PoB_003997800 [Plakobranchus ocellatus]